MIEKAKKMLVPSSLIPSKVSCLFMLRALYFSLWLKSTESPKKARKVICSASHVSCTFNVSLFMCHLCVCKLTKHTLDKLNTLTSE